MNDPLLLPHSLTARTFLTNECYFVGTWRRTPYSPQQEPLCLNGSEGKAHLDTYDSVGSLWKVIPHPRVENGLILECQEVGDDRYLKGDSSLTASKEQAAIWTFENVPPFRGQPNDVSVKLSRHPDRKILCSKEKEKTVHLADPRNIDQKDEDGNFVINEAWEFSPNLSDDRTTEDFFNEILETHEAVLNHAVEHLEHNFESLRAEPPKAPERDTSSFPPVQQAPTPQRPQTPQAQAQYPVTTSQAAVHGSPMQMMMAVPMQGVPVPMHPAPMQPTPGRPGPVGTPVLLHAVPVPSAYSAGHPFASMLGHPPSASPSTAGPQ